VIAGRWRRGLLALAALGLAAGCGGREAGPGPGGFVVQVRTAEVRRQPIEERVALVASLSANEMVEVRSRIAGSIEEIHFEEGEAVEAGRLLFRLDKEKLEASVREAEAHFNMARTTLDRARTMLDSRTISQQEYDQNRATFEANQATLELMRQQLKDSFIRAPFDGIMGARRVSLGQVVAAQTLLGTLVDTDPIKVECRVPERFSGQLAAGQSIEFRVAAYPGEGFRGEVYFIDPVVDLNTRTVLVKARAPNGDGRLRPGMFGNLDLILRVKGDALVIPESALVLQSDQALVYRVDGENQVERMRVRVGERRPGWVEIVEGVQEGDRVVVEGTQKVQPGVHVVEGSAPAAGVPPGSAP
jgi:membrane fusion protein (multidrug efflux system)